MNNVIDLNMIRNPHEVCHRIYPWDCLEPISTRFRTYIITDLVPLSLASHSCPFPHPLDYYPQNKNILYDGPCFMVSGGFVLPD